MCSFQIGIRHLHVAPTYTPKQKQFLSSQNKMSDAKMKKSSSVPWWKTAVFYQIYPRSFADGNGDGIGDLAGIRAKLEYLQQLGIDAIWLSPHYPSPLCDCGYDVMDYEDVAPEYGTLAEFQALLADAHQRGIRIVLDLVLNHTSDQHPWFIESRSSLHNPKRDWYIWKKGRNQLPPNNWSSTFGGSAWEFDPATEEYYYHFFFKGQPDLNWKNPDVKQAMFNAVRFWLDMGVDGFRLDAVGTIFEDETYPPHTTEIQVIDDLYPLSKLAKTPEDHLNLLKIWTEHFYHQVDKPEVHDLMKELRQVVNEYDQRVLIGESDDIRFYGNGDDELHLNFNFPLMRTRSLTPPWVRHNQAERLAALPAGTWPCNTLGNHDSNRMFSNFGDGIHNQQIAEVNLAMLLFMKGTPFLYNGEEIGMSDYFITNPADFRDPMATWAFLYETTKLNTPPAEATFLANFRGRDKSRTPLQWSSSPNGGFCPPAVTPWLPVNPDYAQGINVAEQQAYPESLWQFYAKILNFRRSAPALQLGNYAPLLPQHETVLAFIRQVDDAQTAAHQTCLVIINFSSENQKIRLPELLQVSEVLFQHNAALRSLPVSQSLALQPFEILVYELEA